MKMRKAGSMSLSYLKIASEKFPEGDITIIHNGEMFCVKIGDSDLWSYYCDRWMAQFLSESFILCGRKVEWVSKNS